MTLVVTEPVTTVFPRVYWSKCWSLCGIVYAEKYGSNDTIVLSYKTSVFVVFVFFVFMIGAFTVFCSYLSTFRYVIGVLCLAFGRNVGQWFPSCYRK